MADGDNPDIQGLPGGIVAGAPLPADVQAGTPSPVSQQAAQPPRMGGQPLIYRYIRDMIQGGQGQVTPGQPPQRPPSRGDMTLDFVGQFLSNLSQGLAQAGHGPGANLRGFAAGVQAPYQRELQQYGLQQQQQTQQAQIGSEQARAELERAQAQQLSNVVQTPYGPMSAALASKVFPAAIQAQGRVEAQQVAKRFIVVPNVGLVDTQNPSGPTVMKGTTPNSVMVTPEIAEQYNIPKDQVGKSLPISQFASLERGGAAQQANTIRSRQADIAAGRLSLAQKAFERDTFGTLFGKDIPSSLVDESGSAIGWKSPSAPTSSIKTQGQQAAELGQLFSKVQNKIDMLDKQGKLGPGAGRLSEFMTGKVGADDPDFAELRALGSLTASGMLKAHFGSRGGQQMYQHFEDLFNTGKMTAWDLKGAMKGFSTFMNQYATRVRTAGSSGGGPIGGGTVQYQFGGKTYNIPADKEKEFLKDMPAAKKVQ